MRGLTVTLLMSSACLLATSQVWAQAGLRITLPSGSVYSYSAQEDDTPRVKLRFSGPIDSTTTPGPALATTRPYATTRQGSNVGLSQGGSPAMWADWRPFDNGLRTSAGLMWRDTLSNHASALDMMPLSDLDARNRISTPFVGFGWVSERSRDSRWRLSAEVGAYVSSAGDCRASALTCTVSSGMGLRLDSAGDGIRWNPYLTIGASYSY